MAEVKKEWLAGLTFRTANIKTSNEDGRTVKRSVPAERPLTVKDVLGFRVDGDTAILVAADGRKHIVDTSGKSKKDDGPDAGGGK